jgi:Do/DeqQ family serine protease
MKNIILVTMVGLLSGLTGVFIGIKWHESRNPEIQTLPFDSPAIDYDTADITKFINESGNAGRITENPDFIKASEVSKSSVVFITTLSEYDYSTGTIFDWFFEGRSSQRMGSGSGVIFSNDGYIVTNNHVIEDADQIRVTSGKQTFEAELIGRDPSTDIAVVKVNTEDLPAIPLGSSENIQVGEWVLAVGNPFNLTSTVTAGIVSAKGRNINILRDKFPIESFIQTDAAINPGNSGGALVNQEGELIGINTAILSRTGSYAGYGFAVPVDIVKKVFNDIVKYGEVQKVFIGAEFLDIDSDLAERLNLESLNGVIVGNIQNDGAAKRGGLKEGDVVISINQKNVENKAQIEEYLANLYPGDEIALTIMRDDKELDKSVILLNRNGGTGILEREIFASDFLGASFETVSKVERDLLRIPNGVKIIEIDRRGFFSQLDIPEGFIITAINRRPVENPDELEDILSNIRGRIEIYGINASGRKVYYSYYLR